MLNVQAKRSVTTSMLTNLLSINEDAGQEITGANTKDNATVPGLGFDNFPLVPNHSSTFSFGNAAGS